MYCHVFFMNHSVYFMVIMMMMIIIVIIIIVIVWEPEYLNDFLVNAWRCHALCSFLSFVVTLPTRAVAMNCDEHVCLSVCVSICPWRYLLSHTHDLACCLWLWLGPPPAGWQNPKGKGQFCFPPDWQCISWEGVMVVHSVGEVWSTIALFYLLYYAFNKVVTVIVIESIVMYLVFLVI